MSPPARSAPPPFLLDRALVGPLERQPPASQVLAHPGLGHPHPIQLRNQLTHLATRPQLATKTQVTRQVIQNRLPHCCPLDPGQHLMLTHAPRGQRLPTSSLTQHSTTRNAYRFGSISGI